MKTPTANFVKEPVKLNLARLKKGGEIFEVVVEPSKIVDLKEGKISDVKQAVDSMKIFADAKRGLVASEEKMLAIFGTQDAVKIIEQILKTGEIQLTQEYREKVRSEKRLKIINIIVRNAIDPRTNLPHPRTRIEACFEDARVKIDEFKDAESQVDDILKALRPILPIKFAVKEISMKFQPHFAGAASRTVRSYGKVLNDEWGSDGSWSCIVEIPAGVQNELFDSLNRLTHGDFYSEIR